MTRPTPPSAYDINVYWTRHCEELPQGVRCSLDYEEPTCFACGWYYEPAKTPKEEWRGLERAHVVPHSRGGGNTPDNFALLCKPCHEAAPDTTDAAFFWRWCAARASRTPMDEYVAKCGEVSDIVKRELTASEQAAFLAAVEGGALVDFAAAAVDEVSPSYHWGVGVSAATTARWMLSCFELYEMASEAVS